MINPLKLTDQVQQSYLRYLMTTFEIGDENLKQAFQKELNRDSGYIKGPYLEATPPFRLGRTLRELVLASEFSSAWLDVPSIPIDRALYLHQDRAIQKIRLGRNVIVSTGTGSGKTESFLYPIIDSLMREHEKGQLSPGVRALLLYPMNALVNDQLKRLRTLLKDIPYITFGRFTGETREKDDQAVHDYHRTTPPPNELISRESLRKTPPHILVTNYAMLEYLLQRPDDTPFFDGPYAHYWRFLVLDEVHTYSGASGAEVGMLIRRLKDRLGKQHLQAIGTSATMGAGEKDYPAVVAFATQLFAEPFEWSTDDPERQDVVGAERVSLTDMVPTWGRLRPEAYELLYEWATSEEHPPNFSELVALGIPNDRVNVVLQDWRNGNVQRAIYTLLEGDANIHDLSRALQTSQPLTELILRFATEQKFNPENFLALVNLAVWAKPDPEDQSLIPARYHLFVRATEGIFVAIYPELKVFLQRHETYHVDGFDYPVFELGYCRRCGAAYLVGNIDTANHRLVPHVPYRLNDWDDQQTADYFALTIARDDIEDDTDGVLVSANFENYQLCRKCGWIGPVGIDLPNDCSHEGRHDLVNLTKSPISSRGYHRCVQCGAGSGRGPSRFVTGQDAAAAVVATAVYSALQPDRPVESLQPEDIGKLLVFSDSRQDAAFFAPYLETSYQRIVWRRLIWEALTRHDLIGNSLPWVGDVQERLKTLADQYGMLVLSDLSPSQQDAFIWEVLLREMVSESDIGLERVGMIAIDPVIDSKWTPPALAHWTDTKRTWDVLTVLWNDFRANGALTLPNQVSPTKVLPYETNHMPGFSRVTRGAGMLPWLPEKSGYRNSRLDYIARVGRKLGWPEAEALEWARDLVDDAFTYFTDKNRPWARENLVESNGKNGIRFQAKHLRWTIRPIGLDEAFRCDTCGRITVRNIYGVCPAWRCEGTLVAAQPERLEENHYYQLYRSLNPVPMTAREHTAQINNLYAQQLQEDFLQGDVTVLSCSTTFELGVDAGELEAVFMRNVPPEPANYVQRAGRAGRRTSSAAIAVTFAQRRSHDIAQFNNPRSYIDGRVTPPRIVLNNEKIARRHLHAVVTSWYFRRHPDSFGSMKEFLAGGDSEWDKNLNQLRHELHPVPHDLKDSILRIIPEDLYDELEITTDGWVQKFVGAEGVLTESITTLYETLSQIREVRERLFSSGKRVDSFTRLLDTLLADHCLQFLPSHNVLPKYGFPVDLVGLRVMDSSQEAQRLDLTRDLRLAILEYAPGNTVVAGGYLWKSYGLLRRPGLEWRQHTYAICRECGYFAISRVGLPLGTAICEGCGHQLPKESKMIIPQFGFTTSLQDKPTRPGNQRPDRVGNRRVFFSAFGERGQPEKCEETLPNGVAMQWSYSKWGQFTVLNHGQFGRGYRICAKCGWAEPVQETKKKKQTTHYDPLGDVCPGTFYYTASLGHQFGTDVVLVTFPGIQNSVEFWYSLLYALFEGAIEGLSINRRDLGATLYWTGLKVTPTLVFYDDVPGGAGHVRHITTNWSKVLYEALARVSGDCGCGPETSCYGCLRSYENQVFHQALKRGLALEFLQKVLMMDDRQVLKM